MRLTHRLITRIARIPILGPTLLSALTRFGKAAFRDSSSYWERRYTRGGTSGDGSAGSYAAFKAKVVNEFIKERQVTTVIEFGCGDGNQLSLMAYPRYVGLDVSRSAVDLCKQRFSTDESKAFFVYEPANFTPSSAPFFSDAAISLDVIYHLVEDDVYEKYMSDLFSSARRYVIIFSSDIDANPAYLAAHVKHRRFSQTVAQKFPGWKLMIKIPSPSNLHQGFETADTAANFYIYEKR